MKPLKIAYKRSKTKVQVSAEIEACANLIEAMQKQRSGSKLFNNDNHESFEGCS